MSNIAVKEKEIEEASNSVESMIYEINGTQVMLDSDWLDYINVKMGQKK